MPDSHELAVVELLGALTYGQLRTFEVTSRAVAFAPDARRADDIAELALREHAAYGLLRDALVERTDLAAAVMDRQKPRFDAYFDAMPLDDWLGCTLFFAVGLPMAADFVREIAPTLDPPTALVIVGALADRGAFEQFALEQVQHQLAQDDPASMDRARHLVADILGRALTGFQGALADTDALKVLFEEAATTQDRSAEAVVKQVAISVLDKHRRRMHELGLEDLE